MKKIREAIVVILLLFSLKVVANAEITGIGYKEPLCTDEGIEVSVSYDNTTGGFEAKILKAPTNCSSVPDSIFCVLDSIYYKYGDTTERVDNVRISADVVGIADKAFQCCTGISNINFSNSIEYIGDNAFSGCTGLTSVSFGSGLTSIGDSAFADCPITKIDVPNNVRSIGWNAFDGTVPTSVTLPFLGCKRVADSGWTYYSFKTIFSGKESEDGDIPETIRTVTITDETTIASGAFKGCSGIETINIPLSTTTIEDSAFEGCSSLKNFRIPSSVTSIGNSAFSDCKRFTNSNVSLSDNIESIGDNAFAGCTGLTSVSFGSSLKSIGNSAFADCPLTEIDVPSNVKSIGWNAFEGTVPTSVTLPFLGCKRVADSGWTYYSFKTVFSGKESEDGDIPETIRTVTITDETTITAGAFRGCSKIETINLPDSTTNIPDSAFEGCSSLTNFKIPLSVTGIGNSAFAGCIRITSIKFGSNLTSIGNSSFADCPLTEINVPNNVRSIGWNAFDGTVPINVTLPFLGCKRVADSGWTYYSFKTIFSGKESEDGDIPETIRTVTITDETTIKAGAFKKCSKIETINLPDSTTIISDSAFEGCSNLTNFKIPTMVTGIGNSAFAGCIRITSIKFGSNLTSIGDSAFVDCPLTEINVPQSVRSIGWNAFEGTVPTSVTLPFLGCKRVADSGWTYYSFKTVFSGKESEDGDIPETIRTVTITDETTIASGAFKGCSGIETIKIPLSTTTIENSAFEGCSSLKNVFYAGSVSTRSIIDIRSGNDCLVDANWVYTLQNEMNLPKGLQKISEESFENTDVEVIIIPAGCKYIAQNAFNNCSKLKCIINYSDLTINASEGVVIMK